MCATFYVLEDGLFVLVCEFVISWHLQTLDKLLFGKNIDTVDNLTTSLTFEIDP